MALATGGSRAHAIGRYSVERLAIRAGDMNGFAHGMHRVRPIFDLGGNAATEGRPEPKPEPAIPSTWASLFGVQESACVPVSAKQLAWLPLRSPSS